MFTRCTLLSICLLSLLSTNIYARDYSRAYKQVKDTVVTIHTSRTSAAQTVSGKVDTSSSSLGSGVLVGNGHILTAAHVVHAEDKLEVKLTDGRSFKAQTISSIAPADLAIIRLLDAPDNLQVAKIGDSDKAQIGEEIMIIGAPYGVSQSLSIGHISGRRQQQGPAHVFELEFLQTDAAINKGNSGGPMFNSRGEVIGIVSHILSQSGGSEGLGFAGSINMAKTIFLNNPPVWMGMEQVPLNDLLMRALNVPYKNGLLVQHTAPSGLGAKLGIQGGELPANLGGIELVLGGDIVISIGDQPVSIDEEGLAYIWNYLKSRKKGERIDVSVWRQGQLLKLNTIVD
ncbi:S1C family serine protease [Agaribacterium haliotis]|uniref:S1C family serine protease n=1 Tax=Agaribacterium haliotis TaxID=2013869 RepID=UPI000BB537D3|nr:trypsin-like peptidase domain-containing protein [Agaribacterium haliotis]